jgi:D-alanyl-D-alanine carboxypeptidase/D-alanyl-D-alanine-endopeptidase (penicillin-binding protein 4)
LGEVIRDINKFSNNVMAQQLFLTLGLQLRQQGSLQAAREVVTDWWQQHWGLQSVPVMDNGSGLSRHERISAAALARMLQWAWQSPLMPELVASLPIAGVDGTLKNRPLGNHTAAGAHLKTGSLRDVVALAGYLDLPASADRPGRREVLVAIINHPNAQAARPALQAAVDWALLP